MENYDYKILKYICEFENEPDRPLCMLDIEFKFGKTGRTVAVSLYKEHLISWAFADDDFWSHDDSCQIKATDKGILENERHKYNRQLKSAEVWKERIFGFLFGVFATVAAELIIRYL